MTKEEEMDKVNDAAMQIQYLFRDREVTTGHGTAAALMVAILGAKALEWGLEQTQQAVKELWSYVNPSAPGDETVH
jgi:hypothetical protein